jgi:hypothetical protein
MLTNTYPGLPSFSLDAHGSTDAFPLPRHCSDSYHLTPTGKSDRVDYGFSGFFVTSARQCRLSGAGCDAEGPAKFENRLTSLLDLRMRALAFEQSLLDFVQIGMEDDGMTRVYPYKHKSYGNPSKCYNDDPDAFGSDYCSDCSSLTGSALPAYDSRCRSWYGMAVRGGNPNEVYFQKPRVASSGSTVITAVVPIKQGMSTNGELQGVLNLNVLAESLSNSVNAMKILDTGFAFVVDKLDPNCVLDSVCTMQLILHPDMGGECSDVACASGMDSADQQNFEDEVWKKVLEGADLANDDVSYIKGEGLLAEKWLIREAGIDVDTASYSLFVTVKESEVLAPVSLRIRSFLPSPCTLLT